MHIQKGHYKGLISAAIMAVMVFVLAAGTPARADTSRLFISKFSSRDNGGSDLTARGNGRGNFATRQKKLKRMSQKGDFRDLMTRVDVDNARKADSNAGKIRQVAEVKESGTFSKLGSFFKKAFSAPKKIFSGAAKKVFTPVGKEIKKGATAVAKPVGKGAVKLFNKFKK